MMSFGLLALTLSFLAAPPPVRSFEDAWCREVFEGSVAAAARDYQEIYLSQPAGGPAPEVRRKAALRAGLCFERLGQTANARPAYRTVIELSAGSGLTPEPVVEEARVRLKRLGGEEGLLHPTAGAGERLRVEAGPRASPGSSGHEVPVDVAVAERLEALKAAVLARAEGAKALERRRGELDDRARERQAIARRLARRGVVLSFPPAAPPSAAKAAAVLQALKEALSAEADLERCTAALANRFLDRSLAAARAGSAAQALRDAYCRSVLAGGTAPAAGRSLESWLEPWTGVREPAGLAAAAGRRLVEENVRRSAAFRREIRSLLEAQEDAVRSGRRDRAVGILDRIRDALDWARPVQRESAEVRVLAAHAGRQYLLLARSGSQEDALVGLWGQAREVTEAFLHEAARYVEAALDEESYEAPPEVGGRLDAASLCGQEADTVLREARQLLDRGDARAATRSLREAAWIIDKVPGAEGGLERRRALESLEAAAAAGQQAPDEDDGGRQAEDG
ncbi:MAG: hypothetical protein HY721_20050 [Planctomycetes bacterium]|nr:hypothetical protein [Planctomycetota bacterium]